MFRNSKTIITFKYKLIILILLVILVVFLISGFLGFQIEGARAASALKALITGNMELASGGLPLTQNPTQIVKLVIQGALGLVAIIFFVIIVIMFSVNKNVNFFISHYQ